MHGGVGTGSGTHTEDEEQLDEHGAKGQDPSHKNAAEEYNVNIARELVWKPKLPLSHR